MKINVVMGFFLPMPPAAGGATEKSWHQLAQEFARRGHEVTIVSRTWAAWPQRESCDGVQYLRLPGFAHTRRLAHNLWLDFRWSLRVWRALPAADVTVVNCVALPLWLGWCRRQAGRIVVMTGRMPKGQYRLYRRLDRVVAVSSAVRSAVLSENPRLDAIIRISGYPIDWTQLAAPRMVPAADAPVTIGYVGRLHQEKGLSLLVAALRLLAQQPGLPPWRVILCGPSDIAHGGSGEAYAHHLDQALTEALPPGTAEVRAPEFAAAQLGEVYRSLDVFCYPSLAAQGETFGVAVAEAMAAGAVPVVSDLPCFRDFIRPGENGEVFDHAAADAAVRLAGTLARMLTDPARRTRLATAARETARAYDFATCAERLLADFAQLK